MTHITSGCATVCKLLKNNATHRPLQQLALKVIACFGTKTQDCVLHCLSATSQYADAMRGLEQAVAEGFIVRIGSGWKFVHDKGDAKRYAATFVTACPSLQIKYISC